MDPEFEAALASATRSHDVTGNIQDIRAMAANSKTEWLAGLEEWAGTTEDIAISTRDDESILIRVYRPSNFTTGCGLPVIVWYHGGGFCLGDLDSDETFCRRVSEEVDTIIVSVDYRLAPEWRFPIAINDCWDALQWIFSNASSLGGDIKKGFIIGGGSAGANLAAVVAHLASDQRMGNHEITGVHLGVPLLIHPEAVPEQYRAEYRAMEDNRNAAILSRQAISMLINEYNPPPKDPLFSVLFWDTDLKTFPVTYLQACGLDVLRDDALIFEKLLRQNGSVKTKLDFYPGVPHAFNAAFPELKIKQSMTLS
ncbi:hypothetical protein V500_08204 [Pseudogymnoascus sp. VKM F-4518 (FW-2643)]|nr:hypothetical protein V500_08204 [Pseudogymnoascus sp. VKM F-4518 (FW-2643)]